MTNKITTSERLTKVETKLDILINNHLAHLQTDITAIKKTLWWLFATFCASLISIILVLIRTSL